MIWPPIKAFKRLLKGHRGFTMMEVLVAVGIMTVIGSGLVRSVYQMQTNTSRGSAQLTAEADLRTSMQRLGRDFRMARTTDLVDGAPTVSCAGVSPASCLVLGWTDEYQEASVSHTASYALVGTEVLRTYDGTTHAVARNVTEMTASLEGKLVVITLTSNSGDWGDLSRQVTHYFHLRSLE
jgi:prepilin-type N-terminal cleavage/methylation domain-containing protein